MQNIEGKDIIDSIYIEKTALWSSHAIIYRWLKNYQRGTKMLEIGTASGYLGKKCKELGFHIKGIEPNKALAETAKPYYDEFLCTYLEKAPDEFLENHDIVVCADVLEHTALPEKHLKHLVQLQKPETQFLISIPNVAHIWIRMNLALGKFNYTNYGILDRTHLRFFTKSTFLSLLSQSGLRPIELEYTPAPLERAVPFFQTNPIGRFIQKVSAFLARFLPGLFAYQFVARSEIIRVEGEV